MANPTITSNGGGLLLGVNLAGAEFGTPNHVPGVFGTDYIYPTHTEIDYYAAKGMSVVRLPFLWERLQHSENGPLDGTELARLDDVVNYTTGKGLKIEIEPHNYGYGFGALIGSAETPNAAFADLWGKLAFHYQSNPSVIFGLMNEPHEQSASVWLGSANAAIAAIRAAGASQEILVPGSYWDGAWTWTTTDNAAVIGTGVQDPAHNFAFEVHQYLDADGSGTHAGVVSAEIGVERLTAITQWAEATSHRLFLGEVGVATDQTSLTALDRMLSYMQQHTNVWQGVTYWAGGPWWETPPYMFSIEPQNGVDKPQMAILMERGGDTGAVSILENTTAVTTVTATDPDTGQTLSYSISGGADAAKFIIGPSTGALSFVTAPNFELPTDVGGNNVYDVIVQVSDGHGGLDTQAIAVTVSDVVESNHAPTVAASDQTATRGQVFNASSLFTATDADNDTLLYGLRDNSADPNSGHFTVNGVVQAANQTFVLTAAQLAQTTFTAGAFTSDHLIVNVYDGAAFSEVKAFDVNVPVNHAPTVMAPDFSAARGQVINASSLFTAFDADNDTLLYGLRGNSADPNSGHFTVNGVVQAANQTFVLTAAQLAQATFTAGTSTSDHLIVNVYDGQAFSEVKAFDVNVPVNHAPTVMAPDFSAVRGQVIAASSLFTASDADNDTLLYGLRDNSADPNSGHFTVNGVVQAANQTIVLTAAQLAQTTFTAGTGTSDHLLVNIYDGQAFSEVKAFDVNVPVNHAPTVTAADVSTARGHVFTMSDLFTAFDADNDTLLYGLRDNSADPDSGHFTVNGVVQAANQTFVLTAAQLAQTTFTAGAFTSDNLIVNVYDGAAFSEVKGFNVNVPVNHAPEVTASNQTTTSEHVFTMADLFTATDADNDTLLFGLRDNSADPNSGHFTVNGMVQAANQTFVLTAAELAQTTFTAGTTAADDLIVNVYDGHDFSSVKAFHIDII